MISSSRFLNPAEAAKRLGVSAKALRLYEQRGLISPDRTEAGWRVYGPHEMARAGEIVALRRLGLTLAQAVWALKGDVEDLESALAAHQAALEAELVQLTITVGKVRRIRGDIAEGKAPEFGEVARLLTPPANFAIAFDLPWPWGGERFTLRDVRALNYIIGPLGSGKTRFAMRLAETLPSAAFLGLDRSEGGIMSARASLNADPVLKSRVESALALLCPDGAVVSDALIALLAGLEAESPAMLVVDMVEQGLAHATQEALMAYLRRRGPGGRPLFLMTRSSAILDLAAVGDDEAIIFCPANHSPPTRVAPYPGAPGYEAVATCLASPEVRARTEGTIAWRPAELIAQG